MNHGTLTTYQYYGCSCGQCRAANAEHWRKKFAERRTLVAESGLPDHVRHGASAYRNWGCRCETCTAENSTACRLYSRRKRAS